MSIRLEEKEGVGGANKFRNFRDGLVAKGIPDEVKTMTNEELELAIKTEPFIDPFKFIQLRNNKSRGGDSEAI